MRIIDLTYPIHDSELSPNVVTPYDLPLAVKTTRYAGVCYRLAMNGMSGTYIDFPGHIAEFADGDDAGIAALDRLCMLDATVLHMKTPDRGYGITGADLCAAEQDAGSRTTGGTAAPVPSVLVIHALGEKSWTDIPEREISWLTLDAVEWIVRKGIKIVVSDIYEKRPDQQGVFVELFRNHIWTVCCPTDLPLLRAGHSKCCIIPLRIPGVTQLPCRCFVIEE